MTDKKPEKKQEYLLVCGYCEHCDRHVRGLEAHWLLKYYCLRCDRGLNWCWKHNLRQPPPDPNAPEIVIDEDGLTVYRFPSPRPEPEPVASDPW